MIRRILIMADIQVPLSSWPAQQLVVTRSVLLTGWPRSDLSVFTSLQVGTCFWCC